MTYRDLVLSLGPSLYWPLDATYGATDQSGNGRNGTASGGPTLGGFASSPIAGETTSTDLDGADDRVVASGYNPFTNGTQRTFAGWAYRDSSAGADDLFRGDDGSTACAVVRLAAGGGNVQFFADRTATSTVWAGAWPGTGVWVHWAIVFDESANAVSLYINGALVSTQTNADPYGANVALQLSQGTSAAFDGKLAHFLVVERALSSTEIASLRDGGIAGPPKGLSLAPSLTLHAELTDENGRVWRWDGNAREPGDRPLNVSFRTQRGDGFAECSVTLRRRIDRDYPDLGLLQRLRLIADDGSIAYEGRVSEFPRAVDSSGHTITVTAAGYMASARDRKFSECYVNRDFSRWEGPSVQRRLTLNANYRIDDPSTEQDDTTGSPSLATKFNAPWTASPGLPICEPLFDAGEGVAIGSISYGWKKNANINNADTNWQWLAGLATDDTVAAVDLSANLRAAGPGTGTVTATTATRRFAWLQLSYAAAATGTAEHAIYWTMLAVYGTHGLTKRGSVAATDAPGFYASDLIANIVGRFCPQLDASGVADTTYAVKHFHPEGAEPYEALQDLNKYHLWELSVWENAVLYFTEPTPLDDYDWQIRLDDPGTEVRLQGDSIDNVANGIVVTYTDFTGTERTLTPDTTSDLRDTSDTNPANIWGIKRWIEITVPFPTTAADATQIGRAALAEAKIAKSPGEIVVRGHILDRQGNRQPVWKVRAGQRIIIADHPNDAPRRIVDTSYTGDSRSLSISTDNETKRVEGLFDRIETARKAANLT